MSKFIKLPVELQVPPKAEGEGSTFKIVNLKVRSAAVLGTSPAQDAPAGSTGKTVVYFTAEAGMKPVTTPLSDDEVTDIVDATED